MALVINPEKCTQDHVCSMLEFCPAFAISQERAELPVIDAKKCFECKNCTYYCPNGAVEPKKKCSAVSTEFQLDPPFSQN